MNDINDAISRGDFFETQRLLTNVDSITDAELSCMKPPLYIASQYGRLDIVKLLVEHNCDVNFLSLARFVQLNNICEYLIILIVVGAPYLLQCIVTIFQLSNSSYSKVPMFMQKTKAGV